MTTWRGPQEALETLFWHVVPISGQWAELFFNNVRVGKGELFSVSVLNEAYGGSVDARSAYGNRSLVDEKEKCFERVRSVNFPEKPSRVNALFLFDDPSMAEEAAARWFRNERRVILEVRILVGAKIHRGDSTWLDLAEHQSQEQCGKAYWSGRLTSDPRPEVIVHGRVFFPRWEEFPTTAEVKAGKLKALVKRIENDLGACGGSS